MEFPSAKVVFATVGAFLSASVAVLSTFGIPSDLIGWLKVAAAVMAVTASTLGFGYTKAETNPPKELVAQIQRATPPR